MVKGIASTVLVGSLAAMFACSSSSPGGSTAFQSGDDGGGSVNTANDGGSSSSGSSGGGSSGSGSSGATSDAAGCSASQLSLPAACKTCVDKMCSTQLAQCASCDVSCALTCTSCSSACLGGGSDAGTSSGASDAGKASGDGGGSCAKMTTCMGCTYVGLAMPMAQAPCNSAVSSNNETMCASYLSLVQAAGFCK